MNGTYDNPSPTLSWCLENCEPQTTSLSNDGIFSRWEDEVAFPQLRFVCCDHTTTPEDWIIDHPFYSRHLFTNYNSVPKQQTILDTGDESRPNPIDIHSVPGLTAYPNIMSPTKMHQLIHLLADLKYLQTTESNQVMLFNNIPKPLRTFLETIWEQKLPNAQPWKREPLFDQLFINWYLPGQGITKHVDLPVFDDGILSLSTGDACIMHFEKVDDPHSTTEVVLRSGDGLTMMGDCRYKFAHYIDLCEEEMTEDGEWIDRGHRVSFTMRRMKRD